MNDFIIEFLDWLSDFFISVLDVAELAAKVIFVVAVAIFTLPLWSLPFLYWLVFEKLRDNKHGCGNDEKG